MEKQINDANPSLDKIEEKREEKLKNYLAKTKNGFEVYVDMESSHASTHFAHHPKLFEAVKKAVSSIEANEEIIRAEMDMGEEIGTTDLIQTSDQDEIVYAKRPLREQYSRFVKNKSSRPTSWITIDLRKDGNIYNLYTSFVGRLTPSFPGGNFLSEQSREFWSNHALVWGSQEIVPGTETTECPW